MPRAKHRDTLPLPLPQTPPERRIVIQHSALTGFRHHQAPKLLGALAPDTHLSLARERDNPHDPDAVALYLAGCKLGYLPRGENFVVARLLDGRRRLSARVRELRPEAERNQRIGLEVLMH